MNLGLRVRGFGWGIVSQGATSATNFGLSLLAGWLLGPAGLGEVFVGFTCYLVALGFQRSWITDPFISSSSAMTAHDRTAASNAAITMSLLFSPMAALLIAVVGTVLGGGIGNSLLLFVPWIVPALVQDAWRLLLFRDERPAAAAMNDAIWLVVMCFAAPVAIVAGEPWAIVGCWGIGALAGMATGFVQTSIRPASPRWAARWWRTYCLPLARWLGAESLVFMLGSQLIVFVLVFIVGSQSVGGLRAADSLFAPLSLLLPALALPGLPLISRALAYSPATARSLSKRISILATSLTVAYVGIVSIDNGRLLSALFGAAFASFRVLLLPTGLRQILVALTAGSYLLLKAESRGRFIFASRALESIGVVCFVLLLTPAFGIVGAAWGFTLGYALRTVFILALVSRMRSKSHRSVPIAEPRNVSEDVAGLGSLPTAEESPW